MRSPVHTVLCAGTQLIQSLVTFACEAISNITIDTATEKGARQVNTPSVVVTGVLSLCTLINIC